MGNKAVCPVPARAKVCVPMAMVPEYDRAPGGVKLMENDSDWPGCNTNGAVIP